MDLLKQIELLGVLPVIKIDRAQDAVPLGKALIDGGIPAAEVTFRTDAAEEAIGLMSKTYPQLLVGAGTVLTIDQCDRAIAAGAKFIVSPSYDDALVAHCQKKNILVLPGCATPSDISKAYVAGLEVVKFFPAEQNGGLAYLKAVAPVYPKLRFMPTGGVNAGNLNSYLGFEKVLACGGSWMVPGDKITSGDWSGITALCQQAIRSMMGFEVVHMGINAADAEEARKTARQFETLFGFEVTEGNTSLFASKSIEIMKGPYLGDHGHIAIATNHVARAQAYLESGGFSFRPDSAKYLPSGKLNAIYMSEQVCGFAVHLVGKG